jgi:hypothetical protein
MLRVAVAKPSLPLCGTILTHYQTISLSDYVVLYKIQDITSGNLDRLEGERGHLVLLEFSLNR